MTDEEEIFWESEPQEEEPDASATGEPSAEEPEGSDPEEDVGISDPEALRRAEEAVARMTAPGLQGQAAMLAGAGDETPLPAQDAEGEQAPPDTPAPEIVTATVPAAPQPVVPVTPTSGLPAGPVLVVAALAVAAAATWYLMARG